MRPIRVLVVDDSLMFRKLLVQGLNADPNIEVVADVEDVYAARDAILKFKPHVMTLDVEMPKMNGMEVFERMKEGSADIPVIFLTASGDEDDVMSAIRLGAVNYLKKPFMPQELMKRVAQELQQD